MFGIQIFQLYLLGRSFNPKILQQLLSGMLPSKCSNTYFGTIRMQSWLIPQLQYDCTIRCRCSKQNTIVDIDHSAIKMLFSCKECRKYLQECCQDTISRAKLDRLGLYFLEDRRLESECTQSCSQIWGIKSTGEEWDAFCNHSNGWWVEGRAAITFYYLEKTGRINQPFSGWDTITSSIPQGSVLEPHIDPHQWLDECTRCNVSMFADDRKLDDLMSHEKDAARP